MESRNIYPRFEFTKAIIIYSGFGLVSAIAFGYRYYFFNKGKGIDDFLFLFAILSLPSFFAAMATLKYTAPKKSKSWLTYGLLFTVLAGTYLYTDVMGHSLLLGILLISGAYITCFIIALSSFGNLKPFRLSIYSIFILGFSSGAPPIFVLFILGAYGQVLKLFL